MARVKLLQDKTDLAPEHSALFDVLASRRGRISGPSSVILHSPGLAGRWNQISEFLHGQSIVEPELYEIAVCATAREFDGNYIWAAHEPAARRAGVSEAAIAAVAHHGSLEALPEAESTIVRFVRQLLRERRVEDAVFETLLQAHGARWAVELTAWIGRYAALSCVVNCFEVMPAPEAAVLPPVAPQTPAGPIRPPRGGPRIPLLTSPEQVGGTDRALFNAIAEGRGSVRGPFALLLYSPALCQAVLDLSVYLRRDDFVAASTRELAIIATARERDCPYVWAAHAPASGKVGVSDSVIDVVRDRGALDSLPEGERDVVEFTRQLLATHRVEQALFDRLLRAHSLPGLVELTGTIGHYVLVTTILNAFEVAPAPAAEPLPLR
jgi:4-carboxymuconolactone decarboxylase